MREPARAKTLATANPLKKPTELRGMIVAATPLPKPMPTSTVARRRADFAKQHNRYLGCVYQRTKKTGPPRMTSRP